MITKNNFKALLETLGFTQTSAQIYSKVYGGGGYALKADFNTKKLIYPANTSNDTNRPNGIIIHDDTTSNFSHPENFVVFECVHRLLAKGYSPAHIELEPRWNLGRDAKGGRADIFVRDNEGSPYLLIECKTTDSKSSEFRKEWARMQNDGGQLFSYFQQERGVKFLCLYTSDLVDNALKYENYIINMQDNETYLKEHKKQGYKDASTVKELFSVWISTYSKEYLEQGIFEPQIQSYNISAIKPNLDNLSHIDSHSMQKKRHEWATILRANAVGDRGLALNKFMNLLLCKITDEIENKDDLAFFWKGFSADTPFELVDRLQNLYQIGMQKFLKQNITYHSKDSIDKAFSKHFKDTTVREKIQNIFNELKYFSNGDFNFIEVYNKEQFDKNFNILLPVVLSLQSIKFTDTKDSNILGDYFETYIHDMPQQEGQYFTPVPLVNFIINSLPTFHQTQVLDFACGAGHFLTQYAEFHKGKDIEFFGIDKDSRLAKIAKIASFMHGIDSHIKANDSLKLGVINEQSCNVLISNPPYSVDGFLSNLKSDIEQYELFSKNINTETNDKIQCFFIEKASKALKSGGLLSLVLPSSLLNKSTEIDSKTIEILLRDFYIVSICAFGDSTFFKTGTQPIILYAIRKAQRQSTATAKDDIYEDFIRHILEGKVDKLPQIYDNFLPLLEQYAIFRGFDKDELKALFALDLAQDSTLYQNENFAEYQAEYQKIISKQKAEYEKKSAKYKQNNPFVPTQSQVEFIREKECEKFLCFCYCIDSTPLIIKAPSDKKEQKHFLGYEWSTAKGQEGIRYLNATSIVEIQTPLYNPKNQFDTNKLNYYILQNFYAHFEATQETILCESQGIDMNTTIPKELEKYAFKARLVDMIDFTRADFSKAINLNPPQTNGANATNPTNPVTDSKFELVRLSEMCDINKFKNQTSAENISSMNLGFGNVKLLPSSQNYDWLTNEEVAGEFLNDGEVIALGVARYANIKKCKGKFVSANNKLISIKQKDKDKILFDFVYEILAIYGQKLYKGGSQYPQFDIKLFENFKIPLPPIEIQKQIVAECEKVESQSQNINNLIALYKNLIRAILGKCGISDSDKNADSILAQINKIESSLDFEKEPTPKSPPQGRGLDSSESIAQEVGLDFGKSLTQSAGLSSPSLAEGARGWVENLTALLKFLPTPPQNGWESAKLGEICDISSGGTPKREIAKYWNGNINWIKSEVCQNCYVYENQVNEKITELGLKKSSTKILKKNSVLVALVGATIGKVGYLTFESTTNQNIAGLYPLDDKKLATKFLYFSIMGLYPKFKEKAGFNMANLTFIKNLKIPLPPLSEQNKIIAPIEWIESKITALDSTLHTIKSQKSKILQKYL